MRKNAVFVAVVAMLSGLAAVSAWGQDLQKNYPLADGGRISIASVSGDISVTGYNGTTVQVSAYREGRDANAVEIIDESSGNSVVFRVQYPREGSYDASVRFAVQVPQHSRYQFNSLTTASGDIEVTGVAGDLNAKTASGDLTISQVEGTVNVSTASGDVRVLDVAGLVSARTASGDVEATLTRVEGSGQLSFSSASGDVTVTVPAQISADVEMSTASGSANSDFPLTVDDREGHGRRLFGRIGSGAIPLKISTASGKVRLVRS